MARHYGFVDSEIFDAFVFCPVKPFLKLAGVESVTTDFLGLNAKLDRDYQLNAKQRFATNQDAFDFEEQPAGRNELRSGRTVILDTVINAAYFSSTIDALIKTDGRSALGEFRYEPVMFCRHPSAIKPLRLALAFRAFILGQMQKTLPTHGILVRGPTFTSSRFRVESDIKFVASSAVELRKRLLANEQPDIILNRHCDVCQFKEHCRAQAEQIDHLSLLRGMSEKEIIRHNSKGIFSVKQLSYTFRPRRRPKRAKPTAPPHSYPLKALALREKQIYIHGAPSIPSAVTEIYLDVEGTPELKSDYLIGMIISSGDNLDHRYFWADSEADQHKLYIRFLTFLENYTDFRIFHFGNYESKVYHRIQRQLPDRQAENLATVRQNSINLLSLIYPHIYFPTRSNSLKDIAKFLDFQWTNEGMDGQQSIVLREHWNRTRNPELKNRLVTYNRDDCLALKVVTDFVRSALAASPTSENSNRSTTLLKIRYTEELLSNSGQTHRFGKAEFSVRDFEVVNKCAYFDYQREKVFVRTNKSMRIINQRKNRRSPNKPIRPIRPNKVNKVIEILISKCEKCRSKEIVKVRQVRRAKVDLKFFRGGVKKWVTEYISWRYSCSKCRQTFTPRDFPSGQTTYGDGLAIWCVYNNVVGGQSLSKIKRALSDVFGLDVSFGTVQRFKASVAQWLAELSESIRDEILSGQIVHIDETEVKLTKDKGYVWVFSNMNSVWFDYRDSRKSDFLDDTLNKFSGVMITDFFTGYDSIDCPQQKCLIHLIRDMNDDLMNNPFNEEYKDLAQRFGKVLREIVETIDRYGLKHRHLRKHRRVADRFLRFISATSFSSEVSQKYQKRINKYGDRLFTFLNYDGVPWNNNNAERAIKAFARYRRFADGRLTERSTKDYLVLLSVFQTCEYRNIDILKFLLSKEIFLPN